MVPFCASAVLLGPLNRAPRDCCVVGLQVGLLTRAVTPDAPLALPRRTSLHCVPPTPVRSAAPLQREMWRHWMKHLHPPPSRPHHHHRLELTPLPSPTLPIYLDVDFCHTKCELDLLSSGLVSGLAIVSRL